MNGFDEWIVLAFTKKQDFILISHIKVIFTVYRHTKEDSLFNGLAKVGFTVKGNIKVEFTV